MKNFNGVLLIDDDPVSNFINARLIKTLNMVQEISIIKNGKEALEFLTHLQQQNESCPELILLDINMPVMDGFEFLTEFRKINFSNKDALKIIVLSTSSYYTDIERFRKLHVVDFIVKPLTLEKLKPVLAKFSSDPN